MMSKIALAVSIVTMSASAFAQSANSAVDQRLARITSQLNTVFQCPQRVWPGLTGESYRILFVAPSANAVYFWSKSTGKIEKILNGEFPIVSPQPKYAFIENFRGERAVAVNLEDAGSQSRALNIHTDPAVSLAFHEGFHFLFQMKAPWVASMTTAERNPQTNLEEALYYRRMMIRALKQSLSTDSDFAEAAFWFQRWTATGQAPETKFSDIAEGTANYAEHIASILASRGCGISEAELIKAVISALPALVDPDLGDHARREIFSQYRSSGYQIEGYEIGLMSLLALRARGHLIGEREFRMGRDFMAEFQTAPSNQRMAIWQDLQNELAQVKTPADLLLCDVAPQSANDDATLRAQIARAAAP